MSDYDTSNSLINLGRDEMSPAASYQEKKTPSKDLKNAVLNLMFVEMRSESAMISSNGDNKYGLTTKLIKKWKLQYPWINRNIFNYYVKSQQVPSSVTVRSNPTTISDLSALDPINEEDQSIIVTQNECISVHDEESSLKVGRQSSSSAVISDSNTIRRPGRPKGSTNAKKYEEKVNLSAALNFIASGMKERKEEAELCGRKVKYGTYNQLVETARATYNLPEDVPLKKRCLQRVHRKSRNVCVAHRGKASPMIQVETHLVDIILQYARMRQPITPKVGIALANSMIKGTNIESEMLEWRKKSLPKHAVGKNDPNYEVPVEGDEVLCKGWWRNFLKRNPSISSKKAVRFDSLREDWCSVKNFEVMYEEVYEAMVDSRVAIKLDEEVHVDVNGNVTEEEEGFGRKTKY